MRTVEIRASRERFNFDIMFYSDGAQVAYKTNDLSVNVARLVTAWIEHGVVTSA